MLEGSDYHSLPTEQEKTARRRKLHRARPDLGAVNDKRSNKPPSVEEQEELDRINSHLESKYASDLISVGQLADKYGLEPKKVRQVIRKLGYKATSSKNGKPPVYAFTPDSKELQEIEANLKKKGN